MITALVIGSASAPARAVNLERLVMPGPVIAGHADVEADCDQCHVAFSRDRQRDLCLSCHEDVAEDLAGGTGFHGRDSAASRDKCADCHTEHEGRDAQVVELDTAVFDHDLTDFALVSAHLQAECVDCHPAPTRYREAPGACFDCHEDDDEHRGGLGQDCSDCHSATEWSETRFDHAAQTDYALLGGHAGAACTGCHVDYRFENTPTECYACHVDDDTHDGLNGQDCAFCHTVRDWSKLLFDHEKESGFALLGRHGEIACNDCHSDNKFEVSLEQSCVSCHLADDEHEGLNGTACGDCHTPARWSDTTFDHAADTAFPLLGAHLEAGCGDCHEQPAHEVAPPSTCFGCHAADDPHAGQQGEVCGDCHDVVDWTTNVAFDHDLTVFPLIGQHRDAFCTDCHETPRFHDAPAQCVDCHREDDVHATALGQECGTCHNPNDWTFWRFDHARQTQFALAGAHADLACEACHTRPLDQQSLEFGQCVACHRADDVHRGEFGTDCERCHNDTTFTGARRRP